jgi:Iap family predicted aminopeptidase
VTVEVKIGVQYSARELIVESPQTAAEVQAAVLEAVAAGDTGILDLVDDRGRRILVPVNKLAYVEIGEPEYRKVGFGG